MKTVALMTGSLEDAERLYAALKDACDVRLAVVERGPGALEILGRRVRRFGFVHALGQALMAVLVAPLLRLLARGRIGELEGSLVRAQIPESALLRAASVNDDEVVEALRRIRPDAVLVYGTRIIKRSVLERITSPLINIHAGITPAYRGGHGAYWALADGRPELAGVTVHRIDAGVDTGEILSQGAVSLTEQDSFATYPLLQFARGIELARAYLAEGKRSSLPGGTPPGRALRSHPTAWEYIVRRLARGVH